MLVPELLPIVEPGVSFAELYAEIKKRGLKL
ncbi:hypothetical protein BKA24_000387 [Microbacterium marinum]|uniref:Uncharacterized protein n=1 Tax=Microbacterium marinum TaxID=421115 RepID=A0A7W7FI27_9MICO|nr:hypothetical protein [Microbacterium marinum]